MHMQYKTVHNACISFKNRLQILDNRFVKTIVFVGPVVIQFFSLFYLSVFSVASLAGWEVRGGRWPDRRG